MQSRNTPCPCGSGRRFKQCHGRLTGDDAVPGAGTVDFVVAGTQRGGTTALDLYLREHPAIAMPMTTKELHFFDHEDHFRSEPPDFADYHTNFPTRMPRQLRGEVTPIYMYWDAAAARMARYNPALKIIVILRNPIARAYSHWNKERRKGRETLSFFDALRAEPERTRLALPLQLRHASYVDRGFYCRQLQRLGRHFPVDRLLILRSSALQAHLDGTLKSIADFLGLEPFPQVAPRTANAKPYQRPMGRDEWAYLAGTYEAEIGELERMLEWDCSQWLQSPAMP